MPVPEKFNVDIETFTELVNGPMVSWQKETLNKMYGGIKAGQLTTYVSGRNTGKSTFTAAALQKLIDDVMGTVPAYEVLTSAPVDGVPWYTVSCRKDVSMWVRENGAEDVEWHEHIDGKWMLNKNMFDVSQDMLAMIKLRWS